MFVEWMLVNECNYSCDYCFVDKNTIIPPVTDKNEIKNTITHLHKLYPDLSIYLFGGEPFLHPKIEFIISSLNKCNQKFQIQTNFSDTSIGKLDNIKETSYISITIHPDQINLEKTHEQAKRLQNLPPNIIVEDIQIMFRNKKEAVAYYNIIRNTNRTKEIEFHPIANMKFDNSPN